MELTIEEMAAEIRVLQEELGLAASLLNDVCGAAGIDPDLSNAKGKNVITGEVRNINIGETLDRWNVIAANAYNGQLPPKSL